MPSPKERIQDFAGGRQFYVDKTHFITEWMKSMAKVTLITRPRRFGKTLMLSTVENFLDPRFAGHPEYFDRLKVWKDEESKKYCGKIPVASVTFGNCKGRDYSQAIRGMTDSLQEVKAMYDGFIFGKRKDIYNPWSICNYLRHGELLSYWTNTSSNKQIM